MGVTRYVATYRNKEKIAAQMDALPIVLHGSKTIFISASDVSAIQGHPMSLILVPIENAYATSY